MAASLAAALQQRRKSHAPLSALLDLRRRPGDPHTADMDPASSQPRLPTRLENAPRPPPAVKSRSKKEGVVKPVDVHDGLEGSRIRRRLPATVPCLVCPYLWFA